MFSHRQRKICGIVNRQVVFACQPDQLEFVLWKLDIDLESVQIAKELNRVRRIDPTTTLIHDKSVANLIPPDPWNDCRSDLQAAEC